MRFVLALLMLFPCTPLAATSVANPVPENPVRRGPSSADTASGPLACVAERLRGWARPEGVQAHWPAAASLPASLRDQRGLPLADHGDLADGYDYRLLLDEAAHRAYVVQTGGFAGRTTIYGPLPVAACTAASQQVPKVS